MPRLGGKPKGYKAPKTIEKEALREAIRRHVAAHLPAMLHAQVANAKGLQYLVYRDKKTGKFERVTDVEDVDQSKETIEVWQKDPSVQAFTDLLNRTVDKPKEQEQTLVLRDEHAILSKLDKIKARNAKL